MLLLCRRFLTLFQERVRLIAFRLKLFGKSYGRNCRRCRWLRHLLFFSRQRQNSPKKNKPKMKRVFLMILKCSVEPKAGFMAQYSNFREKTEPVWLKGRYAPKGKGVAFGIGWRRDTPESRYPTAAFLSALRGVSYGITSRDFVCQSPNQKPQIFLRLCSLGAYCPQSPGKK